MDPPEAAFASRRASGENELGPSSRSEGWKGECSDSSRNSKTICRAVAPVATDSSPTNFGCSSTARPSCSCKACSAYSPIQSWPRPKPERCGANCLRSRRGCTRRGAVSGWSSRQAIHFRKLGGYQDLWMRKAELDEGQSLSEEAPNSLDEGREAA